MLYVEEMGSVLGRRGGSEQETNDCNTETQENKKHQAIFKEWTKQRGGRKQSTRRTRRGGEHWEKQRSQH